MVCLRRESLIEREEPHSREGSVSLAPDFLHKKGRWFVRCPYCSVADYLQSLLRVLPWLPGPSNRSRFRKVVLRPAAHCSIGRDHRLVVLAPPASRHRVLLSGMSNLRGTVCEAGRIAKELLVDRRKLERNSVLVSFEGGLGR